jgi:glycosyltransferase involved in cell wall biosynthesis
MQLSIVIPFYNEEKNIAPLCAELRPILDQLKISYEVIASNDGSRDDTQVALEQAAKEWPQLTVLQLRKNFGQAAAFAAGFDAAQGEIILTLDGDLQNDPAYIPKFLSKLEEGWDVVSGWRQHRRGGLTRLLPSKVANWLISTFIGVHIHDTGCMLKTYRRSALENVHLYGELHRFLPALCTWDGARVTEIPIEDRPRQHGTSKYGLGRTFKVFFDLLTIKFLMSYGRRPLHVFGGWGIALLIPGFLWGAELFYERMFLDQPLGNRPAWVAAIFMLILGVQFFFMGLLAELITRSYHESTGRRIYSIKTNTTKSLKKDT